MLKRKTMVALNNLYKALRSIQKTVSEANALLSSYYCLMKLIFLVSSAPLNPLLKFSIKNCNFLTTAQKQYKTPENTKLQLNYFFVTKSKELQKKCNLLTKFWLVTNYKMYGYNLILINLLF